MENMEDIEGQKYVYEQKEWRLKSNKDHYIERLCTSIETRSKDRHNRIKSRDVY